MVKCILCYRDDSRLMKHHIEYKNDITIIVCGSCHRKIHQSKRYPELKQIDYRSWTIIKLSDETHKRLEEFGKKKETFNDVIKRLLDKNEPPKKTI